jgi:hypothetical protein
MPIHYWLSLDFWADYNYDIVIMCQGRNSSDRNIARLFKLKYRESVRNILVRGRFVLVNFLLKIYKKYMGDNW